MIPFKKKEWQYGVTKKILTNLLKNHYNSKYDLQQSGWTAKDIWHFLQLHHWLYPEPFAQYHHYNTIEKILVEVIA